MWTPLRHPWCGLGSKKQRHQRAGSQWSWNNLLLLFLATCLRGTVGSRGHLVSVGLEVLMPRRRHVHQAQSSIEPQPVVTRCFWGVGGWSSNNNSSGQDRLLLGTGVTSPEQQREGKALVRPASLLEGAARRYVTSQVGKKVEGNGIFCLQGSHRR